MFEDDINKIKAKVAKLLVKQVKRYDKEKRVVADTPLNYGIVVGAAISEELSVHPVLNITPDKKFTLKEDEAEFLRVTQETIEKLGPKNKNLFINPPTDSKKEPLLQLADFIASAMNAKYNNEDVHYFEIIKKRVVIEKVVDWTKLKKRIVNP